MYWIYTYFNLYTEFLNVKKCSRPYTWKNYSWLSNNGFNANVDTGKNKKRTGPRANSFCLVNIFKGKNFVFFFMYLES